MTVVKYSSNPHMRAGKLALDDGAFRQFRRVSESLTKLCTKPEMSTPRKQLPQRALNIEYRITEFRKLARRRAP